MRRQAKRAQLEEKTLQRDATQLERDTKLVFFRLGITVEARGTGVGPKHRRKLQETGIAVKKYRTWKTKKAHKRNSVKQNWVSCSIQESINK